MKKTLFILLISFLLYTAIATELETELDTEAQTELETELDTEARTESQIELEGDRKCRYGGGKYCLRRRVKYLSYQVDYLWRKLNWAIIYLKKHTHYKGCDWDWNFDGYCRKHGYKWPGYDGKYYYGNWWNNCGYSRGWGYGKGYGFSKCGKKY